MDILQYYADLENVKKTLLDFVMEYQDRYSTESSKAQYKLLQFVEEELRYVDKEIKNWRRKQ